jgi:hypothetical protein
MLMARISLRLVVWSNRCRIAQIFLYSLNVAEQSKKHMAKGPISFSKDGVKVNVKDVRREDYEDSTQR